MSGLKKKLTCTNGTELVIFESDVGAGLFMDFNQFNYSTVSGVFDERTSFGINGTQIYSKQLSSRPIKFAATLLSYNLGTRDIPIEEVDRRMTAKLNHIFSPLSTVTLIYFDGLKSWTVECISNSLPIMSEWNGLTRNYTFDLIAPDPYWHSVHMQNVDIGISGGLVELPSVLPTTMGNIISASQNIYVPGYYNVYPKVTFYPSVSAPILINKTTNKMLALNRGVSEGFKVEVDTNPVNLTVRLYSESGEVYNATYWISLDSSIDFDMAPGDNNVVVKNMVANSEKVATFEFGEVML